jgi:hypothetical protein
MSIELQKSYGDIHAIPTDGIYIARFLDNASIINLVNFVHKHDITRFTPEAANDLHCTIVYSKGSRPEETVHPVSVPVKAHVKRFEHWPGHNGDGYLVAVLESNALQRIHQFWLSMGCEHSFPEYTPHITLKHPCSVGEYDREAAMHAASELERKPLVVRLLRETLFAIKENE